MRDLGAIIPGMSLSIWMIIPIRRVDGMIEKLSSQISHFFLDDGRYHPTSPIEGLKKHTIVFFPFFWPGLAVGIVLGWYRMPT